MFKQESESEDEEEPMEMKSKYDLMLTDEKVFTSNQVIFSVLNVNCLSTRKYVVCIVNEGR